jgi:hypothetical protein
MKCTQVADFVQQGAQEEDDWVWRPFLRPGTLAVLASYPKVGKSTLARGLAFAVAKGSPFLSKYPTTQGPVLLLAVEEHPADLRRRLRVFNPTPDLPLYVIAQHLRSTRDTWVGLTAQVRALAPVLVILDTLPYFWAVADEADNAAILAEAKPWLALARNSGAAVLLLHHERKTPGDGGRAIRGGGALLGIVDQAFTLTYTQRGARSNQRLLTTIGRYDETPARLLVSWDGKDSWRRVRPELAAELGCGQTDGGDGQSDPEATQADAPLDADGETASV